MQMKTIENDMLISMLTRKLQNSTEAKKKVRFADTLFWNILEYLDIFLFSQALV